MQLEGEQNENSIYVFNNCNSFMYICYNWTFNKDSRYQEENKIC